MSPPKAARMNINSEYQRQFQPWNKLMQSMPEVAANVSNNAAVPSKKTKVVQVYEIISIYLCLSFHTF